MARARWWELTTVRAIGVTLAGVAVGLIYAALESHGYSYGGGSLPDVNRDPKRLLPSFAWKLELLFRRMRARGFDPVLHEGWRTPTRAKALGKDATDLHLYGAAVDILSASRGLDHPTFFQALGEEAGDLSLTWGGSFNYDLNHVQALPNYLATEFRSLETAGSRDALLREIYTA